MKISASEWLLAIHTQVNKSVKFKIGRYWREDGISEKILEDLAANFSMVEIESPLNAQKIAWDAFKLSGKPENTAGDIAVLVKFSFPNGNEKEGVAFLEAKKSYTTSGKFDKLGQKQLQDHLAFTHAHRTLLYDFDSTEGHFQNLELQYYCAMCHEEPFNESYASTIATEHVLSLDDNSRDLLNYSLPFSYVLTTRYLKGFELDYSINAVNMAKGFLDVNDRGGVKYLLVAHVSHDMELEPDPKSIKINDNRYTKLNSRDDDHHMEMSF